VSFTLPGDQGEFRGRMTAYLLLCGLRRVASFNVQW